MNQDDAAQGKRDERRNQGRSWMKEFGDGPVSAGRCTQGKEPGGGS